MKSFLLRLPNDLHNSLKSKAEALNVSLNDYMIIILECEAPDPRIPIITSWLSALLNHLKESGNDSDS